MNQMTENGSSGFLLGVLVGAIAGAGVALLFAPKSGAQLRGELGESMTTLKDTATRRVRDMADRAGSGLNDLHNAVGNAAGAASVTAREMRDAAADGRADTRSRA